MEITLGFLLCSVLVVIGLVIQRKGSVSFIAGYKEGRIRNEKKLANRIGLTVIFFAVECFLLILIHLLLFPLNGLYIGILAVVHLFVVFALFVHAVMV
ncbi:hypothetical protein H9655_17945 [Cytobacillus sp. Sa5YUA1]|uniref:DUF3784 domain-containing protein n=1 Tax=Cytobacillus stercorigallinarum TaxID=2762240 RepID=A0ABR8QTQ8_9BACI|nr:hypothetical protein [Cytobacillus stercorigallinarum]MBD7938921.1 hypothetical protein [Cytobacillus stercorigallinarum]